MNSLNRLTIALISIACIVANADPTLALIAPRQERVLSDAEGYPRGTQEVANLPCRVGCWSAYDSDGFEFRVQDTAEFNDALFHYSKIDSATLYLELCDGPKHAFFNDEQTVDWIFYVYGLHHQKNREEKLALEMEDPRTMRIQVAIGGEVASATRTKRFPSNGNGKTIEEEFTYGPGNIKLEELEIPTNVIIVDKRNREAREIITPSLKRR